MRILQVHTHYRQTGGEDGVVETESQLLQEAGHEVLEFRTTNPEGSLAALRFAGAPWNPVSARQVHHVAKRFRPQVAHVHNTWFALSPAVFGSLRKLGIPTVMTLHNYRLVCAAATLFRDGAPCHDCLGTHTGHAVRHACYRGSRGQSAVAAGTISLHHRRQTWHRDVDQFLALSEFGRQRFVEGGLPAERITVKPNSVADPGPRAGAPSASRTVLFVGRLAEEKGLGTLLDAWSAREHHLELVVVGTGPLERSLRERAPASVRFVGSEPHDAVVARMLRARALVFPSTWYEGQPLVTLEAAASGLPVLLSDLGAMSELFAPDAEQLLVPPGNVRAWTERLMNLADDGFVDRYGRFTRQRFESRYTHQIARENLELAYRSVSSSNPS